MDNSSIPTVARLHVDSLTERALSYPMKTYDVHVSDIQAVQVVHRDANHRDRDYLVYVKGQEPARADVVSPWLDAAKGKHTLDLMQQHSGVANIVAIPETGYRDKDHVYNSRVLHVRVDAITGIVPAPKKAETESIVLLKDGTEIPILTPLREISKNPVLARFTPQAQPAP